MSGKEEKEGRKEARNGFDGRTMAGCFTSENRASFHEMSLPRRLNKLALKKEEKKNMAAVPAGEEAGGGPGKRGRKKGGEEQDASKRVLRESFTKGWHV